MHHVTVYYSHKTILADLSRVVFQKSTDEVNIKGRYGFSIPTFSFSNENDFNRFCSANCLTYRFLVPQNLSYENNIRITDLVMDFSVWLIRDFYDPEFKCDVRKIELTHILEASRLTELLNGISSTT